jgi:hypothetical protein
MHKLFGCTISRIAKDSAGKRAALHRDCERFLILAKRNSFSKMRVYLEREEGSDVVVLFEQA